MEQLVNVPMYQCTNVPMYQCISVSLRKCINLKIDQLLNYTDNVLRAIGGCLARCEEHTPGPSEEGS